MQAFGDTLLFRIFKFGLTSGGGLILDIALFLALGAVGVAPFVANLLSATAGVSFVYIVSVRRIFRYKGRLLLPMFCAYLAWQAIAVTAASWGVAAIIDEGFSRLAAKLAILPVTFTANYVFMHLLTRNGDSLNIDRLHKGSERGDA